MMAGFSSGTFGSLLMEVRSLCKKPLDCVEGFDVKFTADSACDLSHLGGSEGNGEETLT